MWLLLSSGPDLFQSGCRPVELEPRLWLWQGFGEDAELGRQSGVRALK